jgi:hypothetical protein
MLKRTPSKTRNMNKEQNSGHRKDPHLDIPSVANEDKHMNYLASEEKDEGSTGETRTSNHDSEGRRTEWEEGIKEGKRNAEENSFQKRDLDESEEY